MGYRPLQALTSIVIPQRKDAYYETLQCIKLSFTWFLGAYLVLSSVFTLSPPNGEASDNFYTIQENFRYLNETEYGKNIDAPLFNTVIFIGWLIGTPVLSYLSDRFGRRIGLILSCIFIFVALIGQIVAGFFLLIGAQLQNQRVMFWVILGFRTLLGIGIGGNGVISYVWGVEWTSSYLLVAQYQDKQSNLDTDVLQSPSSMISLHAQQKQESSQSDKLQIQFDDNICKNDSTQLQDNDLQKQSGTSNPNSSVVFQVGWSFGCLSIPLLAFIVRNWVYLNVIFLILLAVYFIICFQLCSPFVIPESPLWLQSQIQNLTQSSQQKQEFELRLDQFLHDAQNYNKYIAQDLLFIDSDEQNSDLIQSEQ